jgi:hypothetical protein
VKLPSVCCNNQYAADRLRKQNFSKEQNNQIYRARCLSPHAWAHHLPEWEQSVGPSRASTPNQVRPHSGALKSKMPLELDLTFNRCLGA